MLKTLLKAAGLLVCMAWLNLAYAANMGAINVTSALGHPLKAEIALIELGRNDKTSLSAKLASVDEFKSAGMDYPYSLPKLSFEVVTRSNGQSYLKLSSTQPVNEPFVSILIELSWASGKLLREYTFLLDPAGFVPEQPKVAEVKPVEPVLPLPVPAVIPEAAIVPAEPPVVPVAAAPEAEANKEAAIAAAPASNDEARAEVAPVEPGLAEPGKVEADEPVKMEPLEPAAPAQASTDSILVEKGDTLGKIADAVKPVDVSLERMLVAMYRANVQTFDGKNMNRIKAGKILRMPESVEIEKVTQKVAVREIRAQVADWQDYRQKLAAVLPVTDDKAPRQEAAGKISAAVAEKAPVIKESAKESIKISKGESLGDKVVTGSGAKSKQEKMAADADDAAARNKQALEEQKKIAKLENINKEASKLVELKAAPVAPAVPAESEKKPEVKKPAEAAPVPATASSDFDVMALVNEYWAVLTEDPLVLGGGVAVLLGLGGLGFVMARRGKGGQKKSSPKTEDVGAATGSWRTPVTPSPETGDFTHTTVSSAPMSVAAALDDVDPISEADLFLNFGRDAQAEEILKDALSKNPSNLQVKLKLLSIYVTRKDSKTFSKYAQEIKESGDAAAWERAAVMGQEVDPSNPMYGGVKGEVRNREAQKAEVDFDLGLGKAASPEASGVEPIKDFKMDFDLGSAQTVMNTRALEGSGQFGASASSSMRAKASADVDATSILSREVVNAAQAATPMDFDVSGILPGEAKQIADTSSMDFDISGKDLESTAVLSKPAMGMEQPASDMNFNDLVFDIPPARPKPVEKQPEPIKGGLAFALDIPTSSDTPSSGNKLGDAVKLDMDFGNININLDEEPITRAGGEGKSEQWNEVATKLDLAKAYQEMGDADGAREILEEVMKDGDDAQKENAEKLLQQITV